MSAKYLLNKKMFLATLKISHIVVTLALKIYIYIYIHYFTKIKVDSDMMLS